MLKESPKLAKKSEGVILRSVHLKETPSALRTYLTCFFVKYWHTIFLGRLASRRKISRCKIFWCGSNSHDLSLVLLFFLDKVYLSQK